MKLSAIVGFIGWASIVIAADSKPKEKPLTPAQQKAIAKYDVLPDKFRDAAMEAWKKEFFKNPRSDKPTLLKNSPPYYPDIVTFERTRHGENLPDSIGVLGNESHEVNKVPSEVNRVHVAQVISKTKVLLSIGNAVLPG